MIRSMIAHCLGMTFKETDIHNEQAAQIDRPAFYIAEINVEQQQMIGNRYLRTHDMVVRYFPEQDDNTAYEQLSDIADHLYLCLEYLGYDGLKARGTDMHHKIDDNVLHFFLTVTVPLKRRTNETKMQTIHEETKLKN